MFLKPIGLAILSASLGGLIIYLAMGANELPVFLETTILQDQPNRGDSEVKPRRPPGEKNGPRKINKELQELQGERARLASDLQEAHETIATLQTELSLDNDLPVREPGLGLTPRQEFRVSRLLELGEQEAIKEHQRQLADLKNGLTLDNVEAARPDLKRLSQRFGRELKIAKRDVLVREFGEEKAKAMSDEARNRREVVLASAKSPKQRRTLLSIFTKKNPLSARLIQAFALDHH